MNRIPQYCLHQLRALGSKKRIDVVQPSQIATYACGERLAVELDSEYIRHLVTLSGVLLTSRCEPAHLFLVWRSCPP
jgi:hypothetical protein